MKYFRHYLFQLSIVCSAALGVNAANAFSSTKVKADIHIIEENLLLRSGVEVKLTLSNLHAGSCVYMPAEDPDQEYLAKIDSIKTPSPLDLANRQEASVAWKKKDWLESKGNGVYGILKEGSIDLEYTFNLPGWRLREDAPRIMAMWHPVQLSFCPKAGESAAGATWTSSDFELKISSVSTWQMSSSGDFDEGDWNIKVATTRFFSTKVVELKTSR